MVSITSGTSLWETFKNLNILEYAWIYCSDYAGARISMIILHVPQTFEDLIKYYIIKKSFCLINPFLSF